MGRKKGVILSYILIITEVFSTLLLTPFLLKTLGTAEYGVYKLAGAVNAYLMLLDLGVGNAVTRYISKYRVENDKKGERVYLGVATIYYLAIAIVAIIVGMILVGIFPSVFAKGLTSEETLLGQKLLGISMVNSAVTLGTTAYANVIISYERFAISKGCTIIQVLLRMVFSYVSLAWGMGSIGIVCVQLLLTILFRGYFVLYVLFRLGLLPEFHGIEGTTIKEVAKYSSLILLQMLATQINATVDQLLIGMFVEGATVVIGVYGLGTQIVQYYQSIGSSFNGVLMPGVVKFMNSKPSPEQLTDEMARVGRILFMILAPIWGCFLIHGRQFMVLWAGRDNEQGYYVAITLMTVFLFIMTQSIGSQILWAMNQHKEQAYLKISIVLVNIILTIYLIKWNPLFGATLGTLISLVLGDLVVMNWIFKRKLGVSISNYYVKLLKGIWPSVLIAVCVGWLTTRVLVIGYGWMQFVLRISIMVLIYLCVLFTVGMNAYEKNLIKSMLGKFINR